MDLTKITGDMKLWPVEGLKPSRRNSVDTVTDQDPVLSNHCLQTLSSPKVSGLSHPPIRPLQYVQVWQRVRAKLRSQLYMQKLEQEVQLFGSSTLPVPDDTSEEAYIVISKKLKRAEKIEEFAAVKTSRCGILLHPGDRLKLLWGCIYVFLMLYTIFIAPFSVAFLDDDPDFERLDLAVDGLFLVDIAVTFNTAFYSKEGQLVVSRREICRKYLKTWFLLDFLACFPIYSFLNGDAEESGSNRYNSLLRLSRLPRVYRLLRVSRVYKMMFYRENRILEWLRDSICEKTSVLHTVTFILFVLIAVHLMACCWFIVARIEGLRPETWVGQADLMGASTGVLYIASLMWALSTLATVGYGDISPETTLERVVACLWVTFGMVVLSLTISSITIYLHHKDSKEIAIMNKMQVITDFAVTNKLDKGILLRLREAIRFNATQTGFSMMDKRELFAELPRDLRYEVALSMHNNAVKNIPFFVQKDQVFVSSIVPFLQSTFVGAEGVVYQEREYAEEIYFIATGRCGLMLNSRHILKKLQQGSYFGEVEVLGQVHREFTVQALTEVTLLTLQKRLLAVIKSEFPKIYEEMKEIARIRKQLNEAAKQRFLKVLRIVRERNITEERELAAFLQRDYFRRNSVAFRRPKGMALPMKVEETGEIAALRQRISQLEPMIASTQAQLLTVEKIVLERL